DVAIAEPLCQRHADLWAARSHLVRHHDDGHGSPPPVLVLERGRGNRDALAADVVQNVDLVCERPAGEDLEHLERRLERRVGAPFHQVLDGGTLESLHRPSSSRTRSTSPTCGEPGHERRQAYLTLLWRTRRC